jgi:hypothetical protein
MAYLEMPYKFKNRPEFQKLIASNLPEYKSKPLNIAQDTQSSSSSSLSSDNGTELFNLNALFDVIFVREPYERADCAIVLEVSYDKRN